MKVTEVSAIFGGRKTTFRLERGAQWAEVITSWVGSPLALHHRVLRSDWTVSDIAMVLRLAFVGAPRRAFAYVPEVDAAIEARGAGTYAVLALKILEAHLFGLDPADAVFDDTDVSVEAA